MGKQEGQFFFERSYLTADTSCLSFSFFIPPSVSFYDLSKKNWPPCLPEYLRFFCFDLSKLCEIRKQLEIIYPALLSISFYLHSFRNESVLKKHMHFGWGTPGGRSQADGGWRPWPPGEVDERIYHV